MHIISEKIIRDAIKTHPNCDSALKGWYKLIEKNVFKNFADLRRTFIHIDKVNHLYVFDIGGNKLRLIASIHFNRQKLYIRNILTHNEYDKGDWRQQS